MQELFIDTYYELEITVLTSVYFNVIEIFIEILLFFIDCQYFTAISGKFMNYGG